MNKKLVIIEIVAIIIVLILVVVGISIIFNEKGKFIGTWQYVEGGTITLNSDDTAVIDRAIIGPFRFTDLIGTINYEIANQQVTFTAGSVSIALGYSFQDSNTLVLTNSAGDSIVLTKI